MNISPKDVYKRQQELRSYLGIQEDLLIKVRIDNRVPDLHIDLDAALMLEMCIRDRLYRENK